MEDEADPDRRTLADLSALADGTLDPARIDAVRELIERSPQLRRRYERERRAVSALQATHAERAPHHLRLSIDNRRRAVRRPRSRLLPVGAFVTAVAAAVAALVLLLPGGAPGAPSVSQAAALALRGPVMTAPPALGGKLGQDVQEIYFPDWSRMGWRAVGQRIDRLAGRRAITVYYERRGEQIAYTILTAPALPWPGTASHHLDGVELQALRAHGRLLVTWRRAGHTCILSSAAVSVSQLAKLAARQA